MRQCFKSNTENEKEKNCCKLHCEIQHSPKQQVHTQRCTRSIELNTNEKIPVKKKYSPNVVNVFCDNICTICHHQMNDPVTIISTMGKMVTYQITGTFCHGRSMMIASLNLARAFDHPRNGQRNFMIMQGGTMC